MLKSIVCFCLFAFISVNAAQYEITKEGLQYLAKAKLSDLPQSVQLALARQNGRAGGDASHWCCINEQPITSETRTKIEHATRVVTTKTKVGYMDCGFLGTMKCSQYVTSTRAELYTYIQTYQVPAMSACQSHEVKCCASYIEVAGNCHSFADLMAHQELFQFLSSSGLLTLSGSVGK
ncbi:unnamed protein product [Rotaria magnacalcarata]|uniref:Uncharacterized protein n=1 Tax=Rotaria magnacalcarata TaxID=392030 RepID=A0A815VKP2_9BILA|nr:unnamed protein product [Rotaria magnacalcarata]CAF1536980.1 unnamed protein product [Rotaria magnacalcarata]CAF1933176.1 unnamed protein product [Rotaria magnacalcarata]CAF2034152.1 unnamed protein product [Rotaria magnacalcarata]CAF2104882.1 unnamed protein product [Rotaria magnacalcarata]